MKLKSKFLMHFDKVWCGRYQIPASLLVEVSGQEQTPITLALFRFLLLIFTSAELVGYFFITLGLSSLRPVSFFVVGIVLKIGGGLLSAFFQNKSGVFLSLELQKYLESLRSHSLEIRSFLTERGCTEAEISALQFLPTEVYQSELGGYQRSKILNIGVPIACALALFANGDAITASVVVILGLLSFPIGERFFKENTFRKESELRLGLAARLSNYVDHVYKKHLWLTVQVNSLSQLPLLLFAFRFVWNGTGQLLASFFGLTQGLIAMTGTLAFQKARITSMRTTETTTHLIHALSSPYLLVAPQRWKEHCALHKTCTPGISTEHRNGLLLQHFAPTVPFQHQDLFSLSCFIPSGSICLLKAPSGKGKSTFLTAMTHLIEHRGDILFLSDGQWIDSHMLSREEFDRKIFFFREENVEKSARLVDLMKNISFEECAIFLGEAKEHFNSILVDLAWKVPDNLMEQEIKNMEAHQHSVFPKSMLHFLKQLRHKQLDFTGNLLKKMKGNLASDRITPDRIFSTLSSGEKRRLILLVALESCRAQKEVRCVILDEPLTHLDSANMEDQLNCIHSIQTLSHAPSILLITHHFVDSVKSKLSSVQEICFE